MAGTVAGGSVVVHVPTIGQFWVVVESAGTAPARVPGPASANPSMSAAAPAKRSVKAARARRSIANSVAQRAQPGMATTSPAKIRFGFAGSGRCARLASMTRSHSSATARSPGRRPSRAVRTDSAIDHRSSPGFTTHSVGTVAPEGAKATGAGEESVGVAGVGVAAGVAGSGAAGGVVTGATGGVVAGAISTGAGGSGWCRGWFPAGAGAGIGTRIGGVG